MAHSKGGQVGGFTSGDFAAYYIVMMMMSHLTFTWFMFEFEYRVRSGAFSPLLLQPLHPIHRDIAQNISYKFLTLVVMLPTVGLMVWVFDPVFGPASLGGLGRDTRHPAGVPDALFRRMGTGFGCPVDHAHGRGQPALLRGLAVLFGPDGTAIAVTRVAPDAGRAFALPLDAGPSPPNSCSAGSRPPTSSGGAAAQVAWLGLSWGILSAVWSRGVRKYSAVGS